MGELAFTLWTKALGATAFVACGLVLRRLAEKLGAGGEQIAWTPWFFWLCPVGFFSALCMGQYDSLCLLFLLVQWHPQWSILLSPFLLLTTWQTKKQMPWLLLSGICFAGYFLLTAYSFAGQIGGNLLDFGLLGQLTGLRISGSEQLRINTIYFDLVPYLSQLAPVAFAAPLLAGLVGKLPLRGSCLADRLDHRPVNPQPLWLWAYGTFAVCWGCVWLVPSLFGWCKTLGIL